MIAVYFFYGLAFFSLGFAAILQLRHDGDLPLRKQIPWLAAFGIAYAGVAWLDMLQTYGTNPQFTQTINVTRMILQPTSGLLLLLFGWGVLTKITPLPTWAHLLPGLLIVPIAFVITYASTTFITPSPIEIPIDIWSRYLLYLPGSIMAGIGFLRQWREQNGRGYHDVARLMLATGLAFLFEAFVVGLVVPAAPYGPASYYNYNRTVYDAFTGEQAQPDKPFGLTDWLDYDRVLETTGLPIQFWRMLSAIAVTAFVVKGLDVFDAIQKRQMQALQNERDRAQQAAFEAQIAARQTAENWTDALISISQRIAELNDVDDILLYIVDNGRKLLHSNFMGLALLNGDRLDLELKCFSNDTQTSLVNSPLKVENRLVLNTLFYAGSYRSSADEPPGDLEGLCFFVDEPTQTAAVVQLNLDEKPIGVLWIARHEGDPYSETDLIWLECLADQVVIAIQHGLMTSQLQSLSIIEERGRIAREMHDGLAQVLGYLNLQVQTLETLLNRGKEEALRSELEEMRKAVQLAHADVRENILSLRTTLANEKGLVSAIDEYLNEFGVQTRIEAQFDNEVDGPLNLASLAEVQLVCILQEALTNVRKHAQANRVSVRIAQKQTANECEYLLMEVSDDGVGFVENNNGKRSFGLQTMHERASAAGGELSVHSKPGAGTSIVCRLPCLAEEKLRKQNLVFQ
jgi:signal transduction histidine kinase